MKKKEWSIPELLSTSTAYWKGCALQSAVRLGVFTTIDNDTLSLDEIADTMKADRRGTEFLLNALAAMSLLIKDGNCYSNSGAALEFLSSTSEKYIG
ncbi:MAG: SAM-dependent methyltransferase, partial [Desulfovibrionaceae bacterium]|nr:SAM-dependent methyltransferase [Desulfovibrionaceae bacterium]